MTATRSWTWTPDVVDAPAASVTVELRLVDVGEVEVTVGSMIPDLDSWGADELVLGPFRPDELDDLGAMILAAGREAERWASETAR
jgi:hypothetical protein